MPVSFCKMTGDDLPFFYVLWSRFVCIYFIYLLRYKDDPWLWDLEWDVQEFKLKKMAAGRRKNSNKAVETQAPTLPPEQEEGTVPSATAEIQF